MYQLNCSLWCPLGFKTTFLFTLQKDISLCSNELFNFLFADDTNILYANKYWTEQFTWLANDK